MQENRFHFDTDGSCSIIGYAFSFVDTSIEENKTVISSRVPDQTANEVGVLVEGEGRKIANASILQGIQTS